MTAEDVSTQLHDQLDDAAGALYYAAKLYVTVCELLFVSDTLIDEDRNREVNDAVEIAEMRLLRAARRSAEAQEEHDEFVVAQKAVEEPD